MKSDFSHTQSMQRPQADDNDTWCLYSADTSAADVLRLAAKALGVPEGAVEVLETGGGWLARARREDKGEAL